MFDDLLQGKAAGYISQVFPYILGVTIGFVLIFIIVYVYRGFARRKSGGLDGLSGEQFLSAEQMFKKGLITEEEYKRIRAKVAQQTLAQTQDRERQERERRILAQVALNPDLARELLTPEQRAAAEARKAAQGATQTNHGTEPTARPEAPAATPSQPAAPEAEPSFEELADPLAAADWQARHQHLAGGDHPMAGPAPAKITSAPAPTTPDQAEPASSGIPPAALRAMARRPAARPESPSPVAAQPSSPPSMNMPRVVQARNEARAAEQAAGDDRAAGEQKKRDIDILLEKGAITREEYDRLRQFFE